MHTQTYRKCLFHLSIFGVFISILVGFYDIILDHIFHAIHMVLEIIEMGLDRLVEHLLGTELRETQIIVFYLMLAVGGVLIYITWKILVYLCKDFKINFINEWNELTTALSMDWGSLSGVEKFIVISLFIAVNYLLSFFLF